jgi:hypothetical protein
MDFQTASGQEVFRYGSGFRFELMPNVYRLAALASLVQKPLPFIHTYSSQYGFRCAGG